MNDRPKTASDFLRRLSSDDFLKLGTQQIAYIRPVSLNGVESFAIHAADGTPLGFHDNEVEARALTRQNDLQPLQVH